MKKSEEKNKGLKYKWLVGVDEVGRGPLAGPVSVCICVLPYIGSLNSTGATYRYFLEKYKMDIKSLGLGSLKGKDSKKLSHKQREDWKVFLSKTDAMFFYGTHSAKDIDKMGIAVCISNLIKKLLKKVEVSVLNKSINFDSVSILLDGGLKAPSKYKNQKTIIKGDEKEMVISFASIYAKVTRDAHMVRLAKKYSAYGFDIHKGYGTLKHREAISKKGLSAEHRKSFCRRLAPGF